MNCHFFLYTHSDDEIHGEGGHDELYGGFGNDVLYGGSGDDIVLGDNGNALRRYSDEVPLVKNGKLNVWHKDVILEEVGNITSIARISQKMNPSIIDANSVASASLLFVANAYTEDRSKYFDPSSGKWISDVFTYNLEKAYHRTQIAGCGVGRHYFCPRYDQFHREQNPRPAPGQTGHTTKSQPEFKLFSFLIGYSTNRRPHTTYAAKSRPST